MTVSTTWVFGYGSLVSPDSLGATLGRTVTPGDGWAEATLHGYGRRWNYGIGHARGRWVDGGGVEHSMTIVALGLAASGAESANGVVVRVDADELARLDHRERHYDRVDVTAGVELNGDAPGPSPGDRVVTYVPLPVAVARYESARAQGVAAIEKRYWDLVEGAFEALGGDRLEQYRSTTPFPDVPVLPVVREPR